MRASRAPPPRPTRPERATDLEQDAAGDGRNGEPGDEQERAELRQAPARRTGDAERQLEAADHEQRVAQGVAAEERRRREAGERSAHGDERRGQPVERRAVAPLRGGGDPECDQPADRGERDHHAVLRLRLCNQPADLHEADEAGGGEQRQPALAERHDGRGDQDDCREGRAQAGELPGWVEHRGERHGHGAEQAEAGEDLRSPGDCRGGADRRDCGGDAERGQVGQQLVLGRGKEQGGVPAGDAGSGGGDGCVGLPVAPVRPHAGAEEQARSDGAERDAGHGPDPATVDGQHEEEDDAEHGDGPTGEGEGPRAQPRRDVEVGRLESGRARRRERAAARAAPGPGRELVVRRRVNGLDGVVRLRQGLGLDRVESIGHRPQAAELALHAA